MYIAARSEEKSKKAISDIQAKWPQSKGSLHFLKLDLADLSTIKASTESFLAQESQLHVLINNAGAQKLSDVDGSQKTPQGHEVHLGVNILGPHLFTKLLTPTILSTAKAEPANTVRVVWVSSMGTEVGGEKETGLTPNYVNYYHLLTPLERYAISKAGNWLQGVEFARRYKSSGVISVPCNPGNLASDLYREGGWFFKFLVGMITSPPVYGAYTELWCATSPSVTIKESGKWGESV